MITEWNKTTKPTIKVVEKTHTKNYQLKIEAVTKLDNCFTIYHYKTEETKKVQISTPISLEV